MAKVEWAKLLCILHRLSPTPEPWVLPAAQHLFAHGERSVH
jgi:mannose/cellobiose epimerase-like protein (N-acyl-D-glucosamine 2-epimerase family)